MNINVYPYQHLVLGGTFDFLHLGHQTMLDKAFESGQFVAIGLTSDKFNRSRGKPGFQSQDERLKNLKSYLLGKNYLKRCKIILINDIFGTTLGDPKLEAIVLTRSNLKTVWLINKKRAEKGLKMLNTVIVPYIKDQSGKILSSTRIRDGQIDPMGKSYKKLLLKIAGKRLSESIRTKLNKPLGEIISIKSLHQPVISVGDVTTNNLLQAKIKPALSIVDAKVGRKEDGFWMRFAYQNDRGVARVKNPPGQISKSLILAITQTLNNPPTTNHKPQTILVSGEEDLATIPAILLAPLGYTVLYGQPKKGLVKIKVDLETKDKLCKVLGLN